MKPKHIAIILDGNRRWAKEHNLPKLEGHRRGYENLKKVGLYALDQGIEHLTVFAFSTENWNREKNEVDYLMDLFLSVLTTEVDFFMKNNVRLKIIGRRDGLSEKIQNAIIEAENQTANNTRGQLNLCLNYGGRGEIVDAIKDIVQEGISADEITEGLISSKIWMKNIPDPELIIRTSGEKRLSGFLAWSGTYSELYFVNKNWPDFSEDDLDSVIKEFENRQRRFGR